MREAFGGISVSRLNGGDYLCGLGALRAPGRPELP